VKPRKISWWSVCHPIFYGVYGVHKLQIILPGRFVNAGTLVRNCGAVNVAPTQKEQPLSHGRGSSYIQTHERSWNEHKFGRGFRRDQKPKTYVLPRASSNLLYSN
jgi:hypothetical protein